MHTTLEGKNKLKCQEQPLSTLDLFSERAGELVKSATFSEK